MKDAIFRDIVVYDTRMAVNFVSSWGKATGGVNFRNIRFSDMSVDAKGFCIFNRNLAIDTVFDGIVFENVKGTVSEPSYVSGSRSYPLGEVVFRNVCLPGGVRAEDGEAVCGLTELRPWEVLALRLSEGA